MKSLVKNFVNKIESIKKVIKMIKEQYDAIIAVKTGLFKCEFKYTFKKDSIILFVFYAPTVLKAKGNVGATVTQYLGTNYVYVDDYFNKLTEYEQEAILLHELHHILHGDRVSILSIIKRAFGFKSAVKIEIMADEYAVKNSSKEIFINALNKIIINAPKPDLKEANIRIKHLENMKY